MLKSVATNLFVFSQCQALKNIASCGLVHSIHSHSVIYSKNFNKDELKKFKQNEAAKTEKGRERLQSPLITLLGVDGGITVVTLAEATSIAKRRSLKLIPHDDVHAKSKGGRDIYKLVGSKDYFASPKKGQKPSSYMKGEKKIEISTNISEHHLKLKIKSILQWLASTKQVVVDVSGNTGQENIVNIVTEEIKAVGGKIIQTVNKGRSLHFTINPPRPGEQIAGKKVVNTEEAEETSVANDPNTSEDEDLIKSTEELKKVLGESFLKEFNKMKKSKKR